MEFKGNQSIFGFEDAIYYLKRGIKVARKGWNGKRQYIQLASQLVKLYSDKTTLKGVDGKEVEYLQSKKQLNSCYGIMVTDIVRDSYIYADEWLPDTPDFNTAIEKYNNSSNRYVSRRLDYCRIGEKHEKDY